MNRDEQEAHHALTNAANAIVVADEKCIAADYGSEVLGAVEHARKAIAYALLLIEGKA